MTAARIYIVVMVIILGGIFGVWKADQMGLLKQWLPMFYADDNAPKPEQTLQAPFNDARPESLNKNEMTNLYTGPVGAKEEQSLEFPHREQKEVSDWLIKAVSEILAIDPTKYDEHMKHLATGMDQKALTDFQQFVTASNILQTLKADNLELHCFVEEQPLLLNKGAMEGRYRWLFDMPVALTFMARDSHAYGDTMPVTQHVIIRVQAGRVTKGQGVNELMIESFEVRRNPDKDSPSPTGTDK